MGFLNVILDRFSDLFMRHMKLFLLVMFAMAGGSFVWFTLMCVDVIPLSTGKSNCRLIKHCVVNEPYLILNSDSKPCILVAIYSNTEFVFLLAKFATLFGFLSYSTSVHL